MKTTGILLLAFFCIQGLAQNHSQLLPQPREIKYGKDQLRIEDLSIYLPVLSDKEDIFNADNLSSFLKSRTGINVSVVHEKKGKQILISHGDLPSLPGLNEPMGPQCREAYRISIKKDGISITGNSSAGAWYAVQTLRQMAEGHGREAFFPEAEITDYPAFPYR